MAATPPSRLQVLSQRGRDLFARAQSATDLHAFRSEELLAKMPLSLGRRSKEVRMWTQEEDDLLRAAIDKYGEDDWEAVAVEVPGRTRLQCVQRWKKTLRPGQVKGPWKPEEDALLLKVMSEEVEGDWQAVARRVPGRNAKQCKERWMCNLNPAINHGPWSPDEDAALISLHAEFGGKWSILAKRLTGRTEHAIKTRFLSLQRRAAKMRNWTVDEDRIVLREFMLAPMQNGVAAIMKVLPGRTKKQIQERWRYIRETYLAVEDLVTRQKEGGVGLSDAELRVLIPNPSLTQPEFVGTVASTVSLHTGAERTKTLARRQNSSNPNQPFRHTAKRLEKSKSSSSSQKAAATIGSELLSHAYGSGFQSIMVDPLGDGLQSSDDSFVSGLLNAGLNPSPSVYSSISSGGLQPNLAQRATSSSSSSEKTIVPYPSSLTFPTTSPTRPSSGPLNGSFMARQDSFAQIGTELDQLKQRTAAPTDDMFRAFSGMAPELGVAANATSGTATFPEIPSWIPPVLPNTGSEIIVPELMGEQRTGLRKFASSVPGGFDVEVLDSLLNGR